MSNFWGQNLMKHCEKWSDMVSFVKLDRHPDGETCCEKLGKWFSTFSLGKNIRNCGRIPTNWKHAKKMPGNRSRGQIEARRMGK